MKFWTKVVSPTKWVVGPLLQASRSTTLRLYKFQNTFKYFFDSFMCFCPFYVLKRWYWPPAWTRHWRLPCSPRTYWFVFIAFLCVPLLVVGLMAYGELDREVQLVFFCFWTTIKIPFHKLSIKQAARLFFLWMEYYIFYFFNLRLSSHFKFLTSERSDFYLVLCNAHCPPQVICYCGCFNEV